MEKNNKIVKIDKIQNQIYTIRGKEVMLDKDLAELYQVETKNLNRAVKRNIDRFPKRFCFQLTKEEINELTLQGKRLGNYILRFQNGTLKNNRGKHRKYLPYVFTEQGISMLSAVLRSEVAVKVSVQIIDAFVQMRKFINENAQLFYRLDNLEEKQLKYQIQTNKKIDQIFKGLEDKSLKPKQGIFYNGQIFDAYVLILKMIKSAKKEIILIDNYIDESVLQLFRKRKKKVQVIIYTKRITKILKQDLEKYNQQYQNKKIEIKIFKKSHDRFLIIDKKEIYHSGASLKDLGKKWFAFSKLKIEAKDILNKLKK
ncbi:MAG TPA: ORF6N domain-containing protein [Candidatus Moranbacteria bacterium]|nr:ORF6N domain-containing protein [Candidatus Moranbacteria bacterium]